MKVYIIHENDEWVVPLRAALTEQGTPYEEWFLDEGLLRFSEPPPSGVFYNRMSASSHTRDHRFAPEYTSLVLAWLERYERPVFNGSGALRLEVNKIAQYATLESFGVKVPKTYAAVGKKAILEGAKTFEGPFITKHNRAGKGLGVRLFRDIDALETYIHSDAFEEPIDGVTLIQQYIEAPEPFITRVEFVGGKFLYAVRVDTSEGFELCPADVCMIDDAFCPTDGSQVGAPKAKFEIIEDFTHENIERYEKCLAANDIAIAGIEFIVDKEGVAYTYDINTNTNYNSDAESKTSFSGMGAIASFLGEQLKSLSLR